MMANGTTIVNCLKTENASRSAEAAMMPNEADEMVFMFAHNIHSIAVRYNFIALVISKAVNLCDSISKDKESLSIHN